VPTRPVVDDVGYHSDWGVCSLPLNLFELRKADRPLFLTSDRSITVKTHWAEMQSCFVRVM
jgi:hypothetical protein